jgi:prepilin peptidase CpaA
MDGFGMSGGGTGWAEFLLNNWHVRLVCVLLVVAAYIDGKQLRVPNWLTYPMVFSGLVYSAWAGGWSGLGDGVLGMFVGLACLLPLYAVGGMGAGDVKLLAGVGAWLGVSVTFYAFCVSTVVGAVMAVLMVVYHRSVAKHYSQLLLILSEWLTIRNPKELSQIAARRKPSMLLLPYGIPICVGSIAYFFYAGLI